MPFSPDVKQSSVHTNDVKSCERMVRWMERNSFEAAGLISHHQNHQAITSATVLFQLQVPGLIHRNMCVHTLRRSVSRLFGHGFKPDGEVWVITALGHIIMYVHACAAVSSTG